MKTKTYNVYKFAELDEDEQNKAIQNLYDINVDHDWWDCTFEDAKNIGLTITEFDERTIKGTLYDADEAVVAIKKDHGDMCETWIDAVQYEAEKAKLVIKHSNGIDCTVVDEDNEYDFDEDCDDLDKEFQHRLLEDYRIMLEKDYEYLTGYEAIAETLIANEYDFDEDGKIS